MLKHAQASHLYRVSWSELMMMTDQVLMRTFLKEQVLPRNELRLLDSEFSMLIITSHELVRLF